MNTKSIILVALFSIILSTSYAQKSIIQSEKDFYSLKTISIPEDIKLAATQAEERIKPVAQLAVAVVETGPHVDKGGEEVVKGVCSACHAVGALGSPKIGDKAAWGPRIAQGYDTLVKHAIAGIRSMPARGGNAELTDGEVANAVAYMANQAGAGFKAGK
jgi:cytochrome c5